MCHRRHLVFFGAYHSISLVITKHSKVRHLLWFAARNQLIWNSLNIVVRPLSWPFQGSAQTLSRFHWHKFIVEFNELRKDYVLFVVFFFFPLYCSKQFIHPSWSWREATPTHLFFFFWRQEQQLHLLKLSVPSCSVMEYENKNIIWGVLSGNVYQTDVYIRCKVLDVKVFCETRSTNDALAQDASESIWQWQHPCVRHRKITK